MRIRGLFVLFAEKIIQQLRPIRGEKATAAMAESVEFFNKCAKYVSAQRKTQGDSQCL
jgi:hypothetical protein